MRLFDGKKAAEKILAGLKEKIAKGKLEPKLAVFLIGEDEASKIYIRLKKEAAKKIGVGFKLFKYDTIASEKEIIDKIEELNQDKNINGIIVQLPLPEKFDRDKIISAIDILKDVDGFHIENRRLFEEGRPRFIPPLPEAILLAIETAYGNKKLKNKKIVALVNSDIFGRMLKFVIGKIGTDFKYILRKTCLISGGEEEFKEADILITACGCPNLITGEMIKQGAVVIDGGIYRYHDGRITGDTERKSVEERAEFLTPVPGGIGPLVIALLLKNVYLATACQHDKI